MKLDPPRHDPYSTLEQTKRMLEEKGYTNCFQLSSDGDHIEDKNGHQFGVNDVALNGIYRFVNKDNEAEYEVLYALSTNTGVDGFLQDGFGKNSSESINNFLQRVEHQEQPR